MWNEIINQHDLNNFMSLFDDFHDSCIKEFKYTSGAFVDKNLSMHAVNDERNLKIVFHRQYTNPSSIEIEFVGLIQLTIFPANENYTSEISDATMIFDGKRFYWCDCGGLTINDFANYKGTLICSSKIRWRTVDEYIGENEIYSSKK